MKQYKPKKFETKKFNLNKRESASKRGYDSEWSKFCFRFKHHNKKCYACSSEEKINVDHIFSKREFPDKAKDPQNFMPLCQSCHSTVTGKFEHGKNMDIVGKMTWIKNMRERTDTKVNIKVISYTK